MHKLAGVKWTMAWVVILVLATVNYADIHAQDKGPTKGDKITFLGKGADVAAIPWEKSEIVNHTMKVKFKSLQSIHSGLQGHDFTLEEVYVFHDDGVALTDRNENECFLCSVEYKWHIDPAGTLILEQKKGNDKITLKKLSSKADTMAVLRNEKPAVYTMAGHPPTIPWTKEEIANHGLECGDESFSFYGGKSPASGPFTGLLYLGSAKAAASHAIRWDIDSSGTLHVDSVGSNKDRVMRKISSNEVLKNGRRVDYKGKKMTPLWVKEWSTRLIIILPIVVVLIFVGWRIYSTSKADEAVSNKG